MKYLRNFFIVTLAGLFSLSVMAGNAKGENANTDGGEFGKETSGLAKEKEGSGFGQETSDRAHEKKVTKQKQEAKQKQETKEKKSDVTETGSAEKSKGKPESAGNKKP